MRVAIVYDRINKWGGAERVLLALHKIFPHAHLITSVYDEENASWANIFNIKTSFLQKISHARRSHEMYAPLMPLAFETLNLDSYDLVISLTSEAAKGVITRPDARHICICLTPTRYLWSGFKEYFPSPFLKVLSLPLVWYLRKWDILASTRPDYYIAISKTVAERIKKYYKRNSTVIYPPLMFSVKTLGSKIPKPKSKKDNSYFLLVSRLSRWTPYKKVEIVIEAANRLKLPLVIVGEGKNIGHIREISGRTIKILESLTDKELAEYYKNCKALIFPALEDFGLVMVEAQAFGKPVIAYRGGGALEIIEQGKTGEFFDEQTPQSLIGVLQSFDERRYNKRHCIENAKRFSFERFERELKEFINTII